MYRNINNPLPYTFCIMDLFTTTTWLNSAPNINQSTFGIVLDEIIWTPGAWIYLLLTKINQIELILTRFNQIYLCLTKINQILLFPARYNQIYLFLTSFNQI